MIWVERAAQKPYLIRIYLMREMLCIWRWVVGNASFFYHLKRVWWQLKAIENTHIQIEMMSVRSTTATGFSSVFFDTAKCSMDAMKYNHFEVMWRVCLNLSELMQTSNNERANKRMSS